MTDDLVLIFAYHFPPENVIGALRPFRLYKYLSRLDYQCHVISAADVTQIPGINGQFVADTFEMEPRQGIGWQAERALRKFLLPGVVGSQWAVHAYRAAVRYIREQPRQRVTVFSTFPPVGTHLAAYWLARRHHLPWIADFRDPFADNPVNVQENPLTKNIYRKLEQLIVGSADFVIANTDAAQNKLRRTYPDRADRIKVIWNGFDPEDRLLPLPPISPGRKVCAHVGELYGGRKASPLLHSLRRLIERHELSPSEFQVHFVGPAVEGSLPDQQFMDRAVQEGWVKFNPQRVALTEAHRITQTADSLLLIQHPAGLQVPGKLYEYLQIGRPILAFGPQDTPVERILQKSGVPYQCIYPSYDENELDRLVLQFFRMGSVECRPSAWFENEFNAQHHAEKLSELIQLANSQRVKSAVVSQVAQR